MERFTDPKVAKGLPMILRKPLMVLGITAIPELKTAAMRLEWCRMSRSAGAWCD
jgi:hypothetical protein